MFCHLWGRLSPQFISRAKEVFFFGRKKAGTLAVVYNGCDQQPPPPPSSPVDNKWPQWWSASFLSAFPSPSSTSTAVITLHFRGSWSLLAAPPYDFSVIKPISITQWKCLPPVHLSTALEPDARILMGRDLDSDVGSWFFFLTWGFISHTLNLDLDVRSGAVFVAPRDITMISLRSTCEGGLRHYASDELREKRGITFWKCSNSSVHVSSPLYVVPSQKGFCLRR